jgi:hypothetical protein
MTRYSITDDDSTPNVRRDKQVNGDNGNADNSNNDNNDNSDDNEFDESTNIDHATSLAAEEAWEWRWNHFHMNNEDAAMERDILMVFTYVLSYWRH